MKRIVVSILLGMLFPCLSLLAQQKPVNALDRKAVLDHYYYGEKAPGIVGKSGKTIYLRSGGGKAKPCVHCMNQHAGDGSFVCATGEVESILKKKFPRRADEAQFEAFIRQHREGRGALRSAAEEFVYRIPVIVHVLYYDGQAVGTDHNITAEQVASQFEVLNEDYRMKINTRGYNVDRVGGDARIEFVPALYDPKGNLLAEPGIHRVKAEEVTDGLSFLDVSQRYISTSTAEWLKKCTSWEPNCYFNLWVVGLADGVLGYATFPETDLEGIAGLDTPDPEFDGVVIDYRRFGSYEKGPFSGLSQNSMGRAATHEIGHFLGLRHTWGDGPADTFGQYPDGCSYTDYVDDTPNAKQPMYVNKPLYLCGEREMIENYMDYSSDFVKNIFTRQQIERMHIVMDKSPRRKELLYSSVADRSGNKTPEVTLKASSSRLNVYDIFSFEAVAERFPGSFKWEFEGGIPATSTDRIAGVYFETPGTKQISLTVENNFGSVTKRIQVEVTEAGNCEVQYASTLKSLTPIMPNFSFGGFLTGHGDGFGVKYIANRFVLSGRQSEGYISRVEMDFARFNSLPSLNADTTFTISVVEEGVDSVVLEKGTYWENYLIFSPPSIDYPEGFVERRTIGEDVIEDVIAMIKATPDQLISMEEQGNVFKAKLRRPGKVIAQRKVRVGDALKAYNNDTPLLVMLDNPVRPSTEAYYLVLDTDYDFYAEPRGYEFDLKAGLSPVNFCWHKAITHETVNSMPREWTFNWAPYTLDTKYNGWDVSVLMHLLPVFVDGDQSLPEPVFELPDLVDPGIVVPLRVEGGLPSGVESCVWTVTSPQGKVLSKEGETFEFSFDEAGEYELKLTYIGAACIQRSVSKQIKVKGMRFAIESSELGYPVYCPGKEVRLSVKEIWKAGDNAAYRWYGGTLNGETGLEQTVRINATTTFRVDARDDSGAEHSESITIVLQDGNPVARFNVLTPHFQRGDTLDIYVSEGEDAGMFRVENISENVSHRIDWEGKARKEFIWQIEGIGDKSFYQNENFTFYDYEESFSDLTANGPGLYRLRLVVANRKCLSGSGNALYNDTAPKDTASVYINIKAQTSFGELVFMAGDRKMSIVPPPYSPSFVGYTAYVEEGGTIVLHAVSDEITDIQWINSYTNQLHQTKEIQLEDVRDNQLFSVSVTRSRASGGKMVDFKENFQVMLLLDEHAPSGKAVPDFRPHLDYVCPGVGIKLINSSSNAVSFNWEYDGAELAEDESNFGLSNLWMPNLKYEKPGEYEVKLKVTSLDGTADSLSRTIHVVAEPVAPKLKFSTSANPASAKIVGDSIYVYDGGGFKLIVEGEGIERMVKYETSYYSSMGTWNWSMEMPSKFQQFRPSLLANQWANGPAYPAVDGMQQVRITALACSGEELVKTFYFRFVHIPSIDIYSLEIDGVPQLLEDVSELPSKVSCAGTPILLEVKCATPTIKNDSEVSWYELDAEGQRARFLGNDFNLVVSPEVNTRYEVVFVNKIGDGFKYRIPVQVGISEKEIRLMNIDLVKDAGNVIELPSDYQTPLILWVDEVIHPRWTKEGDDTVLSDQNAVVVEPEAGVYTVTARSGSGDCTYSARVRIKKTEEPGVEPPVGPEDAYAEAIQLYPIPARDALTVENPYSGTAYIVDGLGKLIRSWTIEPGKFQLDVRPLASGTYSLVVRFGTGKDEKIVRRNFVVVR